MTLTRLATQAVRAAALLRAEHGVGPGDAVCPFDLAERMGIVVRLVAASSIEGMYVPGEPPTIFIGAERPAGRRRFTCGHEIGHHCFGHGERIDELDADEGWSPEEFLAQRFAAALLMPKLAVDSAFARRGWSAGLADAERVFVIAQDLGVGFASLVLHMERTLRYIPGAVADELRRVALPRLRSRIAGFDVADDLIVVDEHWGRRAIDLEVGDIALVREETRSEGACVTLMDEPRPHLVARAAGQGALVHRDGTRLIVRVSRQRFEGFARYRHLEEVDDE